MIADVEQMLRAGKVADAIQVMQDHLRKQPNDVGVLMRLAGVAANVGAVPQALSALHKVTQIAPEHGYAWFGIADLESGRGNLAEADSCYRRAGGLLPSEPAIAYNHGVLLERMGKADQAIEAYREAIIRRNDFAPAHNNVGTLLLARGETELAGKHFSAALRADPSLIEAVFNLGLIAERAGDRTSAEERFRQVLQRDAGHHGALLGMARLLTAGGSEQRLEAIALCDGAISNRPDDPAGHHARGVVLERQRRFLEAAQSFQEAWRLSGNTMTVALGDVALALHKAGKLREALAAMTDLAERQPLNARQLLSMVHLRLHFCEWSTIEADVNVLRAAIARGDCIGEMTPALALSVPGLDEEELHKVSTGFASRLAGSASGAFAGERRKDKPAGARPLRIGYLSADFREHAVSHVLAGVLEQHDPGRVEAYAYSYGPDIESRMRTRLRRVFGERFRDIAGTDDAVAAEMMRADGVDILVDLTGWTSNARHELLLLDPAPVKVNWLGYAGSMGHRAFADYVIGDAIVTPESSARHFSETLALMPHSYMPSDNGRVRGPRPSRSEAGLPETGVVFCCFNQPYKITPDVFATWCLLLHEVPGSVLWLVASHPDARANLLREAAARGVDESRLIFAPFAPTIEEHLGRLQLADIALDTAPYNSHSTAVDALWCGVPLVCMRGERFAGRVAASLVTAAGMPELAGDTLDDYHRMALALATDADALQAMKVRLEEARSGSALFDTAGFARDLETLYGRIWEDHCAGRQEIIRPVG
jgi:predicted O-linked N-acetylglucosamine transferase (SPINDLY family)